LVKLLNIKARIELLNYDTSINNSDNYYNLKSGFESNTNLIDIGCYESVVAVIPKWNL
jgi:hypothetical protein